MSLDERGFDLLPSPEQVNEKRAARIGERALEWEKRIRGIIFHKMLRGEKSVSLARSFNPWMPERYGTNMVGLAQNSDDEREVHEELPTAAEREQAWSIARNNAADAVRAAGWRAEFGEDWTLSWRPAEKHEVLEP